MFKAAAAPLTLLALLVSCCLLAASCAPQSDVPAEAGASATGGATGGSRWSRSARSAKAAVAGGPAVRALDLNDPVHPVARDEAVAIAAAKNEWASFAVEVSGVPRPKRKQAFLLRLRELTLEHGSGAADEAIPLDRVSAAQIVPVPADVNRAGYVRHTGLTAETRRMPRALLPVAMSDGAINLGAVRDPSNPSDATPKSAGAVGGPLMFWVDLHIPPETKPGRYVGRFDLVDTRARGGGALSSVDVQLTVYDFVLPDERHLNMVAQLNWDDLSRLYPAQFEAVRPQLLSRTDAEYAETVKVLDQLVVLAQRHRAEVVVPRLQPLVKWHSSDRPPLVQWEGLDSILAPWLNGDAFADRTPLGYHPLPAIDFLSSYEPKSRMQYWSEAASHFDNNGWLDRAPIFVEKPTPGRASAVESIQLSADAAQILRDQPRLRLTLPLEDDQLQFASDDGNPNLIDSRFTSRLMTASPGLVFASPLQPWPDGVERPAHWLRTDLPGLLPYIGAGGDERDVRLWSWLAFLRNASLILWGSPLPRTDAPNEPADPNDLVWFYPGAWFGLDEPVPTVQLKWLRRAQQDFEYLWLARQRGEVINALLMARLITKPVEIQPNQAPDPTYGLMSGTSDPAAWASAQQLLAQSILLREPGQAADPDRRTEHNLQMLRWAEPLEQPVLMGRSTQWLAALDGAAPQSQPGQWLSLRLGIDVYNASDMQPDQNLLQWTAVPVPSVWQVSPKPVEIPALSTYRVQRFHVDARYNLEQIDSPERGPAEVTFTDGFRKRQTKLGLVLPVAASDRRRPGLSIDGKLDDWTGADALHERRPFVSMLNRPALQSKELQFASTASSVYSGWSDEHLYVAFDLDGVTSTNITSTRNFVEYQLRRAWGEDLAQILVQPVYADNTLGPVLHVVCKPTGHWIERKGDAKLSVDPWQPFEGAGVRYMATMDGTAGGGWRGEVRIPWQAIGDPSKGRPRFLRFNFTQHNHSTGESASWAGPVDFGRDDAFTGLLYVRELDEPGIGAAR